MQYHIILIKFWAIYARHTFLKTENFLNDVFVIKTTEVFLK